MVLFSGLSKDSSFFTIVSHKKETEPLDDDPFEVAAFLASSSKK